jgi:hypothetical protein
MTDTSSLKSIILTPEYSTPYNAIIRDDVVMGVPCYFLERWVPVLGTSAAALVNTLRQLDYRCKGDHIEISGAALAREASMSRRHLYTCLDTPWISAFVDLDPGQRSRDKDGKITQQANRYRVRMDDPLTPADADHLLTVLVNLADTPLIAAEKALALAPRDLWAPTLHPPSEHFTSPRPLLARDVLRRAFPTWSAANDDQAQTFARLAEDLHRHVTLVRKDGRTSKIIVPQYFRRRWWPHLGHDLAWVYLWLRGCVYDNPEDNIRRETCWIPSLQSILALIGRPREWWRRNVETATPSSEGWTLADFFQQLASQKGRDSSHPQQVARQFRVALDIPIAPEDRARYEELISQWVPADPEVSPGPNTRETLSTPPGSATLKHTGEAGVCHIETHRRSRGLPHLNTPEKPGSATPEHTGEAEVCHIETQGSATLVHRESESKEIAQRDKPKELPSSKQQDGAPNDTSIETQTHAAAENPAKRGSLFEQLMQASLQTPLYQAADAQTWLEDVWPEPVHPLSPAWILVTSGKVTQRDLVALMLSIWADTTIKQPPRYLTWLIQRWQTTPGAPPVNYWEQWNLLAELPISDWFTTGREQWRQLTSIGNWTLPFGLEALAPTEEQQAHPLLSLAGVSQKEADSNGLDERPGGGNLTIRDIWVAALGQLSLQLNQSTYANWVEGARAIAYADGVITVRARHALAKEWLAERLGETIEKMASTLAQMPITVRFVADPMD